MLADRANRFKDLATLVTIGHSFEGRPIQLLKVTNNKIRTSKPKSLWIGGTHAREVAPPEVMLSNIDYLLNGYPFNAGGGADRHAWNTTGAYGMVQDFKGGSNGQGQIRQESGYAGVYYVGGAIFTKYLNSGNIAMLGYATSDQYAVGSQIRQDFRYGYIPYAVHGSYEGVVWRGVALSAGFGRI